MTQEQFIRWCRDRGIGPVLVADATGETHARVRAWFRDPKSPAWRRMPDDIPAGLAAAFISAAQELLRQRE